MESLVAMTLNGERPGPAGCAKRSGVTMFSAQTKTHESVPVAGYTLWVLYPTQVTKYYLVRVGPLVRINSVPTGVTRNSLRHDWPGSTCNKGTEDDHHQEMISLLVILSMRPMPTTRPVRCT